VAVIAAILRAQWLGMRLGGRRGGWLGMITGVLWYGLWGFISWFGFGLARDTSAESLAEYLPLVLFGVVLYWQVMPILSASMGSSLDMRKLAVYPFPHGKLFQVEILLRAIAGAEMIMVVSAATAGLIGNSAVGWHAVTPAAIFLLFNVFMASGTRSLLERLLSRRRVREVLVFFVFMVWAVPRFLFLTGRHPDTDALRDWGAGMQTAVLPWTATAWAALGHSQFPSLVSLLAWTAVAGWFGRNQFERSLRFDAVAAQSSQAGSGRSRTQSLIDAFYRLPSAIFRDPMAAIIEKELRTLARTPRYRMIFVMGFSFGLMMWLPMILGSRGDQHATLSHHILTVVCVYALTLLGQVSYWNCFGFDRSAAQIYYVAPQPIRTTLIAKNVASLTFIYLEGVILTALVMVFRVRFGAAQLLETALVLSVCSLYMLGMGNISSVQYPRGLNPERVSQGGASSRFQALVFLLYPICLIPVFLAYIARYVLSSEAAFYVVLAFAAVIGGIVYWIAMDSAVSTALSRREQIIADLSTGDAPIASD
jgi:ABC-2 type transport system permease protein